MDSLNFSWKSAEEYQKKVLKQQRYTYLSSSAPITDRHIIFLVKAVRSLLSRVFGFT